MKCARCKLEINTKKERYVRITDFDCEKQMQEVFLHLRCWKDMYAEKITKALSEKVRQVMEVYQ